MFDYIWVIYNDFCYANQTARREAEGLQGKNLILTTYKVEHRKNDLKHKTITVIITVMVGRYPRYNEDKLIGLIIS